MTLAKLILWLLNVSIMLSVFAIGLKAPYLNWTRRAGGAPATEEKHVEA